MKKLHGTVRQILLAVVLISLFSVSAGAAIPAKSTSAARLIEQRELVAVFDMNEEPVSFNPHYSTNINSAQLFTAITEGLVTYHPATLSPAPGTAQSITASPDNLTWTIRIRKDARFSNGDRITAKTYRDSWLKLLDPDDPGELANLLDMVKGVKAYRTGEDRDTDHVGIRLAGLQTLIIELNAPSPYLLNILCHHIFVPVHPANLLNPSILGPETFVSSGAFRVAQTDDDEIYLEKNPYYWDFDNVELDHIRIELRKSSMQLLSEFSSGLVHWSEAYLPVSMIMDDEAIKAFPEYSTSFFYFSATSGPYADPEVRRALALLIPWDEVRDVSASIYKTDTLVPQDAKYHGNTGFSDSDRREALRILKKAGYPNGEGLPTMQIAIYPNARLEQMTDIITDVWSEELQMTIIIDVVPFSLYISNPESSPYSMAYITWIGDFYDPYSFLSLWSSDSAFNPSRYHDPAYDELIEGSLLKTTDQERFSLLRQAEQLLLDTAVVIPIAHGVSVNFVDSKVLNGWYPNLLNIHPFKYMSLTYGSSNQKTL